MNCPTCKKDITKEVNEGRYDDGKNAVSPFYTAFTCPQCYTTGRIYANGLITTDKVEVIEKMKKSPDRGAQNTWKD